MNKKTLPPPPDFDSPEEAKDIIHFLWIKLAELEDRLNQNSRNSSVPYHNSLCIIKPRILHLIGRNLEKSKELNQFIKAIADFFMLLKTVPRLSNTYQTRHATVVVVSFQIESLISDIKSSTCLIFRTHWLSTKSSKVNGRGVEISIKQNFQSMCLMFRWGRIYIALLQAKRRSTIKA
ncbi:hypothetical protein ACP3V1_00325 [Vibrio sp. DNB22_12_1]